MQGLALRFRLFGFPVTIDPSFLFLFLFIWFFYQKPAQWVLEIGLYIFVSVMVHELGHAVAGRYFGLKPSIRIIFMGGLTSWSHDKNNPPTNFQHIVISLAGPFAGFILGGLILAFWQLTGLWTHLAMPPEEAILYLMLINFGWGILNLIPIFPLDGGQVTYYLLRTNSKIPADRVSAILSLAVGGGLIIWAVVQQEYWIAIVLAWIISVNVNRLNLARQNTPRVTELAREIQDHLAEGNLDQGLVSTGELLTTAKVESIRGWATEMSALFLDLTGDPARTLGFIREFKKYLSESAALRFLKLDAKGETSEALGFAKRAMKSRPSQALVTVYLGHLIRTGETSEVPQILQRFQQTRWYAVTGVQIQLRLVQSGAFEASIRVGESLLEPEGQPIIAYNLACAHARLGQAREALRWLEEAMRRGFKNRSQMAADDDLISLHDYPAYSELLDRMLPHPTK